MNRKEKFDLIMNIRRMRKVVDEGERAKFTADELRRGLAADKDHSPEWKAKKATEIANLEQSTYRTLGVIAADMRSFFEGVRSKAENSFDYTDPELQQALTMINSAGKGLPVAVQQQITERFRGNPTALALLRPVYEKYSFNTDTIDALARPFKTPEIDTEEVLGTFVSYATCPAEIANARWEPGGVKRLLSTYESAFGLDTSVNPYLVEIKQLHDTTPDPMQAARIRRFLKRYEPGLNLDRVDAAQAAETQLQQGFAEPIG